MNDTADQNQHTMNEGHLSYNRFSQLENEHGSSFFLLDVKKLRENYGKINQAFRSRYHNFTIGYSYKTNYLPYLCKELSKLGAYAEVVSRLEYDLAIKMGENPQRIIFNGPLKTKEDIDYALANKSIVNIDSFYEIEFVKEFAKRHSNTEIQVGLRLNFDLTENGVSPLQEGYEVSRFGLCVENGDFEKALTALKSFPTIKVVGLHGHFSTRNRSVSTYKKITQTLCTIGKEYLQDELTYIDVGGGIYGELPTTFHTVTPTFADYAEAICDIMNHEFASFHDKPMLILEPGISMVANAFTFITKVIEIKTIRNQPFVLVDGSVHNIKPTMHKRNLPMQFFRKNEHSREKSEFHIVGYTCMEKDYLAHHVQTEILEKGDYILFESVGAYTIVFNPPFIKERPAILAMDDDEIFVVRKKEGFQQFFNEDIYCF